MPNCFYDLHIHSALSPCAEKEMTPNNIVNMALLKGLDFFAVSDHNCGFNLEAVAAVAAGTGISFVPGVEVQTEEEVHMLCLFAELDKAVAFGQKIYDSLPPIDNRPDIFGRQLIMDAKDNIIGEAQKLLINSAQISLEETIHLADSYGGIAIPAHIDRDSYSILSNLGMIDPGLSLSCYELYDPDMLHRLLPMHPILAEMRMLCNSDAHRLEKISEREHTIRLEEPSVHHLIRKL